MKTYKLNYFLLVALWMSCASISEESQCMNTAKSMIGDASFSYETLKNGSIKIEIKSDDVHAVFDEGAANSMAERIYNCIYENENSIDANFSISVKLGSKLVTYSLDDLIELKALNDVVLEYISSKSQGDLAKSLCYLDGCINAENIDQSGLLSWQIDQFSLLGMEEIKLDYCGGVKSVYRFTFEVENRENVLIYIGLFERQVMKVTSK